MRPWPKERLGQLLRHRKEFVTIDDLAVYRRPRVQLHAQGIVLRDEVPGALVKTKQQQVCRAGELLVAEIDAKVGGIGIVPDALGGAIVSSHYFLFQIDETKLDRRFLAAFVQTRTFLDQIEAQGSTNYAAIRPADVLGYEIPLPPPDEQRRLVARIEELAARIHAAHAIRQGANEETNALLGSARTQLIGDALAADWIPLGRFVDRIQSGKSPQCEPRPAGPSEWGVLKVGAVSFGVFNDDENKALPLGRPVDRDLEVRAGDFLMSRANTTDLVGACAVVTRTRPHLLLSDKTFRLQFREQSQVSPRWLDHVMKSPALRGQIVRAASGTSPTMKNISKERVLGLLLPAHTSREQHSVAEQLDALQDEVYALRQVQAEVDAELDALLPAILDGAFMGEL